MIGSLALALLLAGDPPPGPPAIQWERGFADAVEKARAAGKPVLVDFWAAWCHWCKRLDQTTYADRHVVRLSKGFVSVKVNTEGEAVDVAVAERYDVTTLPTILFGSSRGRPLVRVKGFQGPGQFPATLEAALDVAARVTGWETSIETNPSDAAALISLGEHLFGLGSIGTPSFRKLINQGEKEFLDTRSSVFPQVIRSGVLGNIDLAVIKANSLTEEGFIVPSIVINDIPAYVEKAESVVVEIDKFISGDITGIHDIYTLDPPIRRNPIPIYATGDRIGKPYIQVDPDKIKYIIECEIPDSASSPAILDEPSKRIAHHLLDFFEEEVQKGKLPPNLFRQGAAWRRVAAAHRVRVMQPGHTRARRVGAGPRSRLRARCGPSRQHVSAHGARRVNRDVHSLTERRQAGAGVADRSCGRGLAREKTGRPASPRFLL